VKAVSAPPSCHLHAGFDIVCQEKTDTAYHEMVEIILGQNKHA